MKIALIYYSLDGNTEFVAAEIEKVLKADRFKIETKKEISNGISKYFFGGKQVIFNEIPEIEDLKFNVESYDKIVLASPCWARSVSPAIKSFLLKYPLKNKEIALLLCHAGRPGKAMDNWISLLDSSNKIIDKRGFINPMRFQPARSLSVISGWAEDLWQ